MRDRTRHSTHRTDSLETSQAGPEAQLAWAISWASTERTGHGVSVERHRVDATRVASARGRRPAQRTSGRSSAAAPRRPGPDVPSVRAVHFRFLVRYTAVRHVWKFVCRILNICRYLYGTCHIWKYPCPYIAT